MFAELLRRTADAIELTPVSGRAGIPKDVVARDVDEELRWAPVVVAVHAYARALLDTTPDERVNLDRLAGSPR